MLEIITLITPILFIEKNGSCKSRYESRIHYGINVILFYNHISYSKMTFARIEVSRSNIKNDNRESELHFGIKYEMF